MIQELGALLRGNTYPGRGIVLGRTEDGRHTALAYFIMGRSENSRNRVFVREGEGIRTQAFDPAKLTDPSLIIYAPVRVVKTAAGTATIVTNGDQTDTIYDALREGKAFEDALRTRTFEPDAPNFTPRISGLAVGGGYRLSILKSAQGNAQSVRRFFYEYPEPLAGEGHFIHTYRGDGDPIPSFEGEPATVGIGSDIDVFTGQIWGSLNMENKVALYTCFMDRETGEREARLLNKHEGA